MNGPSTRVLTETPRREERRRGWLCHHAGCRFIRGAQQALLLSVIFVMEVINIIYAWRGWRGHTSPARRLFSGSLGRNEPRTGVAVTRQEPDQL